MTVIRVGIVGVGPRGLTLLERIVAHERATKSTEIEVYLFDPNEPGVGCHDPDQPDFLLVNTVAGQVTQFADESVRDAGPVLQGPSFYQWLHDNQISQLDATSESLSPDAYYSRGMFGRYLQWVFRHLCDIAPAHVSIYLIRNQVEGADRDAGGRWLLQAGGDTFPMDYLFLTTGHTKPKPGPARLTTVVEDPYPIRRSLAFIQRHMAVGIEGMGLTAFDALAELTVGRGGEFISSDEGHKRYVPSGQEPSIVLFSRSGLPLSARAVNQKGVSQQYRARFLRLDTVRQLRAQRKLDFQADILPLLVADMEYAYCEAYLRQRDGVIAALSFCSQFESCATESQRLAWVARHIPSADRFSWEKLVAPVPPSALASPADFRDWLMLHLRLDLLEARKGNLDSPLKAASDVLRDLRDTLRAAIDFGGLTEASHRWLYSDFVPVMNRVAVGPPASRIAELLALVDAGIVSMDLGPGAACAVPATPGLPMCVAAQHWPWYAQTLDVLVRARISNHSPVDDASPLMRSLLDAGHVRLFRNGDFHPGGIEVDRHLNWVTRQGEVIKNAWALGIPTEGVRFYTFVVPRPGVNSTAVVDAGRVVQRMLALATSHGAAVSQH
jgi:FAD-NAD(P)-binding